MRRNQTERGNKNGGGQRYLTHPPKKMKGCATRQTASIQSDLTEYRINVDNVTDYYHSNNIYDKD